MTHAPEDEAVLLTDDPGISECWAEPEPAEDEAPSRFFLIAAILRLWGAIAAWLRGPEEDPGEVLVERDAEEAAAAKMKKDTEGAWMEPYLGAGRHADDLSREVVDLIKRHRDEVVDSIKHVMKRRVDAAEERCRYLEAMIPERVRDHVQSLESDCANLRRRVDELANDKVIMSTREQSARDSVRYAGEQLLKAEAAAAEAKAQLIRSSADWQTERDALDAAFMQAPSGVFLDARTPVHKVLALITEVGRVRDLCTKYVTKSFDAEDQVEKLKKKLKKPSKKTRK